MMDFIERIQGSSIPDFIKISSNGTGALRAVDALVEHMVAPTAARYGIIGAGAGGLGGFISGDDGSKLNSAITGALLGGLTGAGGGILSGRRAASQVLQEISPNLTRHIDEFSSPTLSSLRRATASLPASEQNAIRGAASAKMKELDSRILPELDDILSIGGGATAGAAGLGGFGYGSLKKDDNRQFGEPMRQSQIRFGPPPPPMYGYGRPY